MMDLVNELYGYLIENNCEKIHEFESRSFKYVYEAIENCGIWRVENLKCDDFAECYLMTRMKAEILSHDPEPSNTVIAGRYESTFFIFFITVPEKVVLFNIIHSNP